MTNTKALKIRTQLSEPEAEMRNGISASLGCYNFMTSWIFISILLLLLSNLAMITIHACRHRKQARWRFILNHTGLWLALFAGFLGSSDTALAEENAAGVYINEFMEDCHSNL